MDAPSLAVEVEIRRVSLWEAQGVPTPAVSLPMAMAGVGQQGITNSSVASSDWIFCNTFGKILKGGKA